MRAQLSIIATAIAAGAAIVAIELATVRQGSNDIAFTASVALASEPDENGLASTIVNDVVDDAGKIRRFKDADDFMKQAGALGMLQTVNSFTVQNLALVAPKPFTGDIVKKNVSIMAGYVKRNALVAERVAGLTAQLALVASTPGVPASVVTELTAQKTAVEALGVWLTAEIARIDAIVNP